MSTSCKPTNAFKRNLETECLSKIARKKSLNHEKNWGAAKKIIKSRTIDQRWLILVDFDESVGDNEGVFGKRKDTGTLFLNIHAFISFLSGGHDVLIFVYRSQGLSKSN